MARRAKVVITTIEPPPDDRPQGVVAFASPLGNIEEQIHTFNEPHSNRSTGTCEGIRPLSNPWSGRIDSQTAWENMNRRRGVSSEDTEDVDG